ncbi:LEA type 2 family protein [Geopseudomonas aromaticivorans]
MIFPASITRTLGLLLLLLASHGLSGCASAPSDTVFKNPDVQLVNVELVRARLLEQEFRLRFRIDNPDNVDLSVRSLKYTVFLEKVKLASGKYSTWLTVPARSYREFDVPVSTNLWRQMKDIAKLLKKPDNPITYRLQGDLTVGLMFRHHVNIKRSGTIVPGAFIPE